MVSGFGGVAGVAVRASPALGATPRPHHPRNSCTHQLVVKGLTTVSPFLNLVTAVPTSTTVPVNSCPIINPVADFWCPLNTWSSLPHSAVRVT